MIFWGHSLHAICSQARAGVLGCDTGAPGPQPWGGRDSGGPPSTATFALSLLEKLLLSPCVFLPIYIIKTFSVGFSQPTEPEIECYIHVSAVYD